VSVVAAASVGCGFPCAAGGAAAMNGVAWLVLACALAVVVLVWAEYRAAQPMRVVAKLAASSAFVAIAWRLDANGAWDEATAARFLAACARLPVEGVEEPLTRPGAAALARLQADLPFPLAVDESWHLVDEGFLAAPPVRRLILKPPRHGGLLAALHFGQAATGAGLECIITSSLESACGLTAVAHLAAALAPQATHGLATGDIFLRDTGDPPPIRSGRLYLPTTPGLGFRPSQFLLGQ